MQLFGETAGSTGSILWIRKCVPNAMTLLALGAGSFSICMAVEGQFETAIAYILLAAVLDTVDGHVARRLSAASKFGAELDSLANLVNFGVAPALLLYLWASPAPDYVGWWAVILFVFCTALRLARFNARAEDESRPDWDTCYFEGVPTPVAALIVLLPFYLSKQLAPGQVVPGVIITIHLITVGLLMISRLPTFSSKHIADYFAGSIPLPLTIAGASGGLVLLLAVPWLVLIVGCATYIATIGPSYFLHKRQMLAEPDVELPY